MKNLIATVLGILIALLLGPVLCYVCGWIGDWVLLRMFGGSLGIAVTNGRIRSLVRRALRQRFCRRSVERSECCRVSSLSAQARATNKIGGRYADEADYYEGIL